MWCWCIFILFCLVLQMNVYYQSLKAVTGGQLDLYIYPVAFVHPDVSTSDACKCKQNKQWTYELIGEHRDKYMLIFNNTNMFCWSRRNDWKHVKVIRFILMAIVKVRTVMIGIVDIHTTPSSAYTCTLVVKYMENAICLTCKWIED